MKLTVASAVFAALCAVAFTAAGHGGEDHDAPPPPVNQSVAPRAVAATEEFEVVVVLDDRKLLVYVDRFASNEPVTKAKVEVEVEGAGLQGLATETAPGTYARVLATPLAAARHALTITIEAGDSSDLLSATLDTSAPATPAAAVHDWGPSAIWKVAAVLLLVAVALLLAWRRSMPKGN